MKLLVADDDPTLREELAALLREDEHEVITAADGGEALRIVERESFDVALLDLRMPKATGLDVLRRLRVVRPDTAVVMITGEGTIDAAVEAMKGGAVDFVEKPYEIEALRRTLQTVEEERKARALLGAARSESSVVPVLAEAADRKALLAVIGPGATPPSGTSQVFRIEAEGRPPNGFAPSQLYHLNAAIEKHLASLDRPVLYAADLSLLEAVHGRDDLRAWVRHMSGKCAAKGGTLVLASPDSELASAIAGVSEADPASEGLQGMLESLANPIRRAVVGYVFTSGPVAYSGILKKSFVDSSSKLSFHLQKLQADGLLTKADAGRYAVTESGQRAWHLIRALSERKHSSLLISKT
jgi:FixJ family two-component response regulator